MSECPLHHLAGISKRGHLLDQKRSFFLLFKVKISIFLVFDFVCDQLWLKQKCLQLFCASKLKLPYGAQVKNSESKLLSQSIPYLVLKNLGTFLFQDAQKFTFIFPIRVQEKSSSGKKFESLKKSNSFPLELFSTHFKAYSK